MLSNIMSARGLAIAHFVLNSFWQTPGLKKGNFYNKILYIDCTIECESFRLFRGLPK